MNERPEYQYLLPVAEGRQPLIQRILQEQSMVDRVTLVQGLEDRLQSFHFAHAALAASGTVSLELMMTNTPSIIAYKMSWFTAWLAKHLVNVRYASLLNIMLDKMIFPEFLQDQCHKDNISAALDQLMTQPETYNEQLENFEIGKSLLTIPQENMSSSSYIAGKILRLINQQ